MVKIMIRINSKNKTITFEDSENSMTFNLLIAFICPKCKNILLAYWQDDNSNYNPEFYNSSEYKYISIPSAFSAKGIELNNPHHNRACINTYSNLVLEKNIKELMKDLNYHYKDYNLDSISLNAIKSNKYIIDFLEQHKITVIYDICNRENPMIQFDVFEHIGDYSMRKIYKEGLFNKFLKFFGISRKENSRKRC